MTVGDLLVINQRARGREAGTEGAARILERQKARKWCTASGVCLCSCAAVGVFVDSGSEQLDINCFFSVPEVRFSGSEFQSTLNTRREARLLIGLPTKDSHAASIFDIQSVGVSGCFCSMFVTHTRAHRLTYPL